MLQSQKIISCLLCIAILLGTMLTITCFAVGSESSSVESSETSSQETTESSQSESSYYEDDSSDYEESEVYEESAAESSEEAPQNEDDDDDDDYYYYGGDQSYAPYTGSRVLKNPNISDTESTPETKKKVEDKNITDWSDIARRWVFLPILFTLLSIGGLIGFNVYANKVNGKTKSSKKKSSGGSNNRDRRNFERPKH